MTTTIVKYSFEDYVQMDPRIGDLLRAAKAADSGNYYGTNSSGHAAGFAQGNRVSLSARAQLGL